MNVGELLKERDRLLDVIAEAKTARAKLKQINTLIAMYGDQDNVTLLDDANVVKLSKNAIKSRQYRRAAGSPPRNAKITCSRCNKVCKGSQGFAAHNRAAHNNRAKAS